jgi:hypothetical protein
VRHFSIFPAFSSDEGRQSGLQALARALLIAIHRMCADGNKDIAALPAT